MGQESEHNLVECLQLRVSREDVIKLLARVTVMSGSIEAEGSAYKLTHLAVARPQSLATWTSP